MKTCVKKINKKTNGDFLSTITFSFPQKNIYGLEKEDYKIMFF